MFIYLILSGLNLFAQNENKKWYFGQKAGLDFMTSPPTIIANSAMTAGFEGCGSIADPVTGNTLFYTDGITVWNQYNLVMPNGTTLRGNSSSTQSGVIVKQPGNSNIYYIFTTDAAGFIYGFNYSVVDMSLAGGTGSVTSKNIQLYTPTAEKVTAIRHCNGVDVWVVSHDWGSNNFYAHLVTAAGVNPVPVTSSIGTVHNFAVSGGYGYGGYLKASPNGKKLGLCICSHPTSNVELYDFDIATGVVSNSLSLGAASQAYGCEFSPDGTKFYATNMTNVLQWDLCAGSGAAIAASIYTVASVSNFSAVGAVQLASNGKIYVACTWKQFLSVIDNPNAAGAACNYIANAQSVGTGTCAYGLPNFLAAGFAQAPLPFTHTVSNVYGCQTASFNAPPTTQTINNSPCLPSTYSVASVLWNFGDPTSGAANTSTLLNPAHSYSTLGTYTAQLIVYYNCKSDTFRQAVNINLPCIAVTSKSITCATLGSATVSATGGGPGPFSYTWMPSGQTGSVATNLGLGTYTVTVQDLVTNFTYTAHTTFVSPVPLTATVANSPTITCYGGATGTAMATQLAGGSSTQIYLWTNGAMFSTSPHPTNLTAGTWTYTITDALTGCVVTDTFIITSPPALTLNVSSSSPTLCAGSSVVLTGTASGGSPNPAPPAYGYTWTNGPPANVYTPTQPVAGIFSHTLTASDRYNCLTLQTVTIDVIPNPNLAISSTSICPLQTATLNVSGASSYSWNGVPGTASLTVRPLVSTAYTVSGEALGCTSSSGASVTILPVPVPVIALTSDPRICVDGTIRMNGSGGFNYVWTGPLGLKVTGPYLELGAGSAGYSGTYTLTASNALGCTGSSTQAITVVNRPAGAFSISTSQRCAPFVAGIRFNTNTSSSPAATMSWVVNGQPFAGNSFSYFVAEPGNYPVYGQVTNLDGCSATFSTLIQALPPPQADFYFSPDAPLEGLEPVVFTDASTGAVSWKWFFESSKAFSTLKNPSHVFELPGTYNVALVASNALGCSDTIVKPLVVSADFAVYIPNAFTPDADGLNDNFGPVMRGADSYHFVVMNRWGETVFETRSLDAAWDGSYKGKPCKQDVYVWTLEVKAKTSFNGDQAKKLSGQVLLYR